MGNGKFHQISIPTESIPLNRSPSNLSQVIMSATPYSCAKFAANPSTGDFCGNGWTITHLHVRPSTDFRAWCPKRRWLTHFSLILLPIWGSNPQKHFGVRIGVFKPNFFCKILKLMHYWNYYIDSKKFSTTLQTTKYSLWLVQYANNKSNMADGRHSEKSNIAISQQWRRMKMYSYLVIKLQV